jgi:uncharacterized membrane protein (Fun14 family)
MALRENTVGHEIIKIPSRTVFLELNPSVCASHSKPWFSPDMLSPMPNIVDQITPYLGQISFGGLAGFAVGYALKKIGRVALVVFGLLFITVQVLAYLGFIEVNWLRIQQVASPVLERSGLEGAWKGLLGVLTQNIPFAAAFVPGLLLGLRMG